jgi:hypothetical protein
MDKDWQKIQNAKMLIDRLERLSADSIWAHKASGLRGSLWRCVDRLQQSQIDKDHRHNKEEMIHLNILIETGFEILRRAAEEITSPEDL